MFNDGIYRDKNLEEIFHKTEILRKPISGIVSGYHELPYVLVAPDDKNPSNAVEVNGTINVSPRFIVPPDMLGETFGDVFDPETFDKEIQARVFSFFYTRKRGVKLENTKFHIANFEEKPEEHIKRVLDELLKQENVRTGLIFGPKFCYYPVSLDRFIREILDREFNI